MKKPHISLLLLITCVFAAFTLGLFVGRNRDHGTVEISIAEPPAAVTETASPELAAAQATMPATAAEVSGAVAAASAESQGLVNINTATQAELMTLPGIGEVLAQRIIDYRTTHGDFGSVGELLNVSGIGEKKLEAILDLVTTGG